MMDVKLQGYIDGLPDTKPGNYYVSVIDGERYGLLLGPFLNNHMGALAMVQMVKNYVLEHYVIQGASFWGYGTCRVDVEVYNKPGVLNDVMNWRV